MNFNRLIQNINWNYVIIAILLLAIFGFFCGNIFMAEMNKPNKSVSQEEGFREGMNSRNNSNGSNGRTISSPGDKGEIVLYYASWCGFSRQFLPVWEKFEEMVKKDYPALRVTRIQCESDNEALCLQKGIEGYPTVVVYPRNKTEVVFDGERTAEKLMEFAKENTK